MSSINQIETEYRQLLNQQKERDDISSYTAALILMAGLMITTILLLFIMNGYSSMLLAVVFIVLIMFSLYRVRMSSVTRILSEHDSKLVNNKELSKEIITHKLQYLESGIDVQMTRVRSVKQFYSVVFPLFLVSVKELLHGPMTLKFHMIALLILLIISYVVWGRFFRKDTIQLEEAQRATRNLLGSAKQLV